MRVTLRLILPDPGGLYHREKAHLINDKSISKAIRTGYQNNNGTAFPTGIAWFENVTVLPSGAIILDTGDVVSESVEKPIDRWLPPNYGIRLVEAL